MTIFHVGDKVKYTGRRAHLDKAKSFLNDRDIYEVQYVERGIDGACDWDDITLVGIIGRWCEFNFELIEGV